MFVVKAVKHALRGQTVYGWEGVGKGYVQEAGKKKKKKNVSNVDLEM